MPKAILSDWRLPVDVSGFSCLEACLQADEAAYSYQVLTKSRPPEADGKLYFDHITSEPIS